MARTMQELDRELAALSAEVEALRRLVSEETAEVSSGPGSSQPAADWRIPLELVEDPGQDAELEWYACG